ncbi:hypothetical protein AVEN_124073-1 [Araneus ventricosus]|uniref:Uncharacterized protein n=1 Tax=Araneus ventricosus TaxID=182803 RepID=A0A4Y2QNL5_ARAVE|nr:hypothetical protein AVEN_124073-1 [Araneus ventricosus]
MEKGRHDPVTNRERDRHIGSAELVWGDIMMKGRTELQITDGVTVTGDRYYHNYPGSEIVGVCQGRVLSCVIRQNCPSIMLAKRLLLQEPESICDIWGMLRDIFICDDSFAKNSSGIMQSNCLLLKGVCINICSAICLRISMKDTELSTEVSAYF